MKSKLLTLVLVGDLWLAAVPANAQPSDKELKQAAGFIHKTKPDVSNAMLKDDMTVIKSSYEPLKAELGKKGFSASDIEQVTVAAWVELRSSGTTEPLNASLVAGAASKLGKLEIVSDPAEAKISIDGEKMVEPTNTTKWLKPTYHRIKITLEGYEPDEDSTIVSEGQNKPYFRKLKKRDEGKAVLIWDKKKITAPKDVPQ